MKWCPRMTGISGHFWAVTSVHLRASRWGGTCSAALYCGLSFVFWVFWSGFGSERVCAHYTSVFKMLTCTQERRGQAERRPGVQRSHVQHGQAEAGPHPGLLCLGRSFIYPWSSGLTGAGFALGCEAHHAVPLTQSGRLRRPWRPCLLVFILNQT